jgi:hypothetical protein
LCSCWAARPLPLSSTASSVPRTTPPSVAAKASRDRRQQI